MPSALGIVSYHDSSVYIKGMQKFRPVAAFSFLGRFRLIDIPLSNMTNSGMDRVQIYVNGNPRSLIEHVGRGRQYNINSKHGRVSLLPLYKPDGHGLYTPDIEAYHDNLHSIAADNNEYVIVAPINFVYRASYDQLLQTHIDSGADISILCQNVDNAKEQYVGCDVLTLNRQKGVQRIERNLGNVKYRTLSLQTYIMSKALFIECIETAREVSTMYWLKDIVNDFCLTKDVRALAHRGTFYCISDLQSYFQANLAFLDEKTIRDWSSSDWPIYTRTNDSSPTIYLNGGFAQDSLISNGCEIAGVIRHSIVGRSCKIGHDALIENCIICPGVTIGDGAVLKNMVVDKYSYIMKKKELSGTASDPLYIARREIV